MAVADYSDGGHGGQRKDGGMLTPGRMRIIAGRWRSRVLVCPRGDQTRPMPDRMRESVFDILGSLYGAPGILPPLMVVDAFAGSGAIGLEAMSRGARMCCFLECHPVALKALRANAQCLQAGADARILPVDAWKHRWEPVVDGSMLDLLLLDPPYRDSGDASADGKVCRLLADVAGGGWTAPDAVAVLHHPARVEFSPDVVCGWRRFDSRRYGSGAVTFFRRCP